MNVLGIVWQHTTLPIDSRSDERVTSSVLDQRLITLRETILDRLWTFSRENFSPELFKGNHWRNHNFFRSLEKQYVNEVGFIDTSFLNNLSKILEEITYPGLVDSLSTNSRGGPVQQVHENQLHSACDDLMVNYYHHVARMIQYKALSVVNYIRKEIYPQIATALMGWFQYQQKRFPHKSGLIPVQLAAHHQWRSRMEVVDLALESLLLVALTMDEREAALPRYRKEFLHHMYSTGIFGANGMFPIAFCRQILRVYYERCQGLIRFATNKDLLDTMCTKVLTVVTKIRDALTELTRLRITHCPIPQALLPSTMKSVVQSLNLAFGSKMMESFLPIRETWLAIIGQVTDDELHESSTLFAPIDKKLLTDRQPLSKRRDEELRRPFSTVEVIQTSLRETLCFGFMLGLVQSRGNAVSIEALRRDVSGLLQKLLYYHRCKVIALQTPDAFKPWPSLKAKAIKTSYIEHGDIDPFIIQDVLQTGMTIVWQSTALLQSEYRLVMKSQLLPSSSLIHNADKQSLIWISLYTHDFMNTLTITLLVVMLYLGEAMFSNSVTEFDGMQFLYHQHCYDFTQDIVTIRQSLLHTMVSITAEYPQDIGFHQLMNRASYSDHCVNINCNDVFSMDSVTKVLTGIMSTMTLRDTVDSTLTAQDAMILAVILVASIRTIVIRQMIGHIYSHALRAMNCDRRAHNTNGRFCIDGFSRNMFTTIAFTNLSELMDVVDEMKDTTIWMLSDLSVNSDREALFIECVTIQTLMYHISIEYSTKVVKTGLARRDSKLRASQGHMDPLANYAGISVPYLTMLDAEESKVITIREEAWRMFYQWRTLYREALMTMPDVGSLLLTVKRRIIRMRLLVMTIALNYASLKGKLCHIIDEDDDEDVDDNESNKRQRYVRRTQQQQEGTTMLQGLEGEIQRVLQMVGVRAYCEDLRVLLGPLKVMKNKPIDMGKYTVKTHNTPLNLLDIESKVEEVINVYGTQGCDNAGNDNDSNTGMNLLSHYLTTMEKCLDMCLTILQVLTVTYTHSEDDIDYGIDGSGNRFRDSTTGEVNSKFVRDIVIEGLHKPLDKMIKSNVFHSMHKYVMQSPFVYSLAKLGGVNKKGTVVDCRNWLQRSTPMKTSYALGNQLNEVLRNIGEKWVNANQKMKVKEEAQRLWGTGGGNKCDENTMILFRLLGITCN